MVNHTYSVLLKARGTQPQGNPLTPASLVTTPPDTTATHGAAKPHCGKRDNPQTHIEQTTAGALCPQITQDGMFPSEKARRSAILSATTQDFRFILLMDMSSSHQCRATST